MNLEHLVGSLIRIVDNIEINNKNHSILNETILTTPPSPVCEEGAKKEEVYRETGLLASLEITIDRLDSLSNNQNYNINRTSELIKYDSGEVGQQKVH